MPFIVVYECTHCHHRVPINVINRLVPDPPRKCERCLTPAQPDTHLAILGNTSSRAARRNREPGQIYKGLQLLRKKHTSNEWAVRCLWCKEAAWVSNTNIGNQASCGCLRNNRLTVNYWVEGSAIANATCRVCGLTADYNLLETHAIVCKQGCQSRVINL